MTERLDRRRVLVVEDEPHMARLFSEAFEEAGYAVTAAGDGAAGLDAVRAHRPDLVVLDLLLPVMNGWQFMEAFRTLPAPRCPVVAVTAAGPGAVRSARAEGDFAAVLEKPVELDELVGLAAALTR